MVQCNLIQQFLNKTFSICAKFKMAAKIRKSKNFSEALYPGYNFQVASDLLKCENLKIAMAKSCNDIKGLQSY